MNMMEIYKEILVHLNPKHFIATEFPSSVFDPQTLTNNSSRKYMHTGQEIVRPGQVYALAFYRFTTIGNPLVS